MRTLFTIQILAVCAAAGVIHLTAGATAAAAALYGGAAALSNSLLLAWRAHQAKTRAGTDPHRHLRTAYLSAVERLVIVALVLGAGLGALRLEPLPLLAGFAAGQLALLISGIWTGLTTHVD